MKNARRAILGLILIGGSLGALRTFVSSAREAARQADCKAHLKQLGLALANYHDEYGVLPAVQTRLPDGNVAHSWRVMILPYWDRTTLYEHYDMAVPWNHANNDSVRGYRTRTFFYGCPSGHSQELGTTNYSAIIDTATAWPLDRLFSLKSITDNPSETILVIESADAAYNWSAPLDPTLDELVSTGVAGNHPTHVNALFADLAVRSIRRDIAPETLRALLTVAGGEKIDAKAWRYPRE